MRKVLLLASVASMIDQFNISNIQILQNMGYEVHVACNFRRGNTCTTERIQELKRMLHHKHVKYFNIDFERNVSRIFDNYIAYKQVLNLIRANDYDFIHCHSPIGGLCGRLAAHKTKTKIIYTAHGFHFYKGAPVKNWIFYYPIERWLSKYTDILITINKEDYNYAKKHFKSKSIKYIHGVGIDTQKIIEINNNRLEVRKKLNIPENAFVVLSVGELNKNKNHEVIIKAIAELKNSNIFYLICGQGDLKPYLTNLSYKYGIEKQVILLGFRNDILKIYNTADVFAFPSFREGLSVALMEAMASKLPIICSNIRGNTDLIEDNKGGYLLRTNDIDGYADCIMKLMNNKEICQAMGTFNINIIKNYDIKVVKKEMYSIYNYISKY